MLVVRAAIAVWMFSLCVGAQSQQPTPTKLVDGQNKQTHPTETQTQTAYYPQGTDKNPVVIKSLEAEKTAERTEQERPEREEKSANERSLIVWTVVLSVATVALVLVAGGQLAMFWVQLGLMRQGIKDATTAANAAEKSADASMLALRPWLSCNIEIAGPLTFNAGGDAGFRFKFVIENIGKTPAMSVDLFFPKLTLMAPGMEHSILKLQKLAALSRGLGVPTKPATTYEEPKAGGITNPTGRVLFPGETYKQNFQMSIPNTEIIESCKDIRPETNFWPELVVLVSYVYNLAEVRADTGFVFTIRRNGSIAPFKIGEDIPADELLIEPHEMWGGLTT